MKIKTYIDLFGREIVPTDPTLPTVHIPTTTGWISYIQTILDLAYAEGTTERLIVDALEEQTFQMLYGKRKLLSYYKLVNNAPTAYGLTADQAKKLLLDELGYFIQMRLPDWVRMYETLYSEYNPISNYDRNEESGRTLTKEGKEETAKSGSEATTRTGSVETEKSGSEITTPTGTETVETDNSYNGYNAAASVPVSDTSMTTSFTDRQDELSFDDRKDTETYNNLKDELSFTNRKDTLSFDDRKDTDDFESHIWGNIGVTTSQQMIESELNLRRTDLFTRFMREIADRFLLSVY